MNPTNPPTPPAKPAHVPTVAKGLRLRVEHANALETLTATLVERGTAVLPSSVRRHLSTDRAVSESEVAGACVSAVLMLLSGAPHYSLDERERVKGLLQEYERAWRTERTDPSAEMPPEVAGVLRGILAQLDGIGSGP